MCYKTKTSFSRFVSSQIHEDRRVFYAQVTLCAVRYDVIYHPTSINSQYLNTSGVDSSGTGVNSPRCESRPDAMYYASTKRDRN